MIWNMLSQIETWLAEELADGAKVGVDPFVHTIGNARTLSTKLEESGKTLVPITSNNLVDKYVLNSIDCMNLLQRIVSVGSIAVYILHVIVWVYIHSA